jgi:hypothetical protein
MSTDDVSIWLTDAHRALLSSLDDVLNLDAGLADVQLADRHTRIIRSLDDVLDIESGLADILPKLDGKSPAHSAKDPSSRNKITLLSYAVDLIDLPASARITLRTWFPIKSLARVLLLARLRCGASELRNIVLALQESAYTTQQTFKNVALEPERVDAIANFDQWLRHADHSIRGMERALDQHADDNDISLAESSLFHADSDDGIRLNQLRIVALLSELELVARDLVNLRRDIEDFDASRWNIAFLMRNFSRFSNSAENLFGELGHDLTKALASVCHETDDPANVRESSDLRYLSPLREALAHAKDKVGVLAFDADAVEALRLLLDAVTNAVGADLSNLDLTDIPLDGVRWSSETRWPTGWGDHILAISEQIGPDLYRVRPGTPIRDRVRSAGS